jgi:hypothetical protein
VRTPLLRNKTTGQSPAAKKAALAVVVALSAALLAPPAALADPPPPLDRCLQNMAPDVTEAVTHNGNQVGVSFPRDTYLNPANGIFPGDVVKVTITGTVRIDRWGNSYGPGGATGGHETYWKSLQGINWPFPELNAFSSVARWNNNPGGWVGSPARTVSRNPAMGGSCTAAPNIPVRLLYYINDPDISDNGGQWTIRTDVYRATTTCPPGFFYSGIYGCIPRPW